MHASAPRLPKPGEKEVALDGEQPRPEVAVAPPQGPPGDGPFKRILDEIVGCIPIAQERPGIAPERRDLRLDQRGDLVRHQLLAELSAGRLRRRDVPSAVQEAVA